MVTAKRKTGRKSIDAGTVFEGLVCVKFWKCIFNGSLIFMNNLQTDSIMQSSNVFIIVDAILLVLR